eukprot:scaffold275540_cov52-Prasinocladus_malaysianus.AAC.1
MNRFIAPTNVCWTGWDGKQLVLACRVDRSLNANSSSSTLLLKSYEAQSQLEANARASNEATVTASLKD